MIDAPEILDACCGGRMWWWDKAHPLAVYIDQREAPAGSDKRRPNWNCAPDTLGDFRDMPFDDEAFQLVVFDPPHIVRDNPSGFVALYYGTLPKSTEQDDLKRGFAECWRVLAAGGTLVFKWAGALDRVRPHFPSTPVVGTRSLTKKGHLGTRWFIFYKPLREARALCACESRCGDVAEDDDHPKAVCKGLTVPVDPLIEIVLVDRRA